MGHTPRPRCRKTAGRRWVTVTQQDFKQHCMDRARIGHSSASKTYLHPETWSAFWNQGLKRSLEVLGFASLTVQSQRILSPLGWQNQTLVCASWLEDDDS
ncbi:unnamed protein product [Symbiodinium sp. CCMP2592]|nr:unnamed protein product [Symbiodinium sp. CCMP2592]